ncbi:MAG: hypothetical protein R3B13_15055 [Polyangiaceae bacterium]
MAGRWLSPFLMLVAACGGATPPAEAPEASGDGDAPVDTPAESEATPSADESAGTETADSESNANSDAPANTTLSDDDLREVLQQVLGDPDLARYFHLDRPGRLPLKIQGEGLPAKLEVTVGGYDVKVVDQPPKAKDAVMVFTKIERDGDSARLRYEYDVEGVRGSAVVYYKGGTWRLGANRVIEK